MIVGTGAKTNENGEAGISIAWTVIVASRNKQYPKRSDLRATVWEMSDGQCEHPAADGRCQLAAVEMSHITPRGMGHTGYRDHLGNVMAACPLHARSTDDLSSPEWAHVGKGGSFDRRTLLANYVNTRRRRDGWDV